MPNGHAKTCLFATEGCPEFADGAAFSNNSIPDAYPWLKSWGSSPKKYPAGTLDTFHRIFIPVAVSYILGLYRNFIRRIPLLSNIKVLHVLDSQSHGILSRRDFGTLNSSSRDFGRSVWRALCAIGLQIHRAHASHVLGLSRNCTLPCICCPGPVDRKKHQQPRIITCKDLTFSKIDSAE